MQTGIIIDWHTVRVQMSSIRQMLEDFDVETMDTTGKIDFYFGPASSSMAANASKVMNANFDLVPMVLPTKTH